MITCVPKGDPQTSAIVRGCVILIVAAAVALVLACICAAIPSVSAAPAEQATVIVCQSIGSVKLAPNIVGVNVRAEAGYTAAIIADAIKPNTSYAIDAVSGVFYRLCAGGWVASKDSRGQVLLVFTAAPPTQAVTVTPTRIPSATPGASPTQPFIAELCLKASAIRASGRVRFTGGCRERF